MEQSEVLRVARLARLKLTEEEIGIYAGQLTDILQYVEQLQAVDTEGVEPMAHPAEVTNVLRDDAVTEPLPVEQALANAPRSDGRYFLVPAILDAG